MSLSLSSKRKLALLGFLAAAIGPGLVILSVKKEPPLAKQVLAPGNSNVDYYGLKVDHWVLDLGTGPGTGYQTGSFSLTNTTNQEILLENVRSSCGCTIALLQKGRLAPGETTVLPVHVDTSVLGTGPFEKSVVLTLYSKGEHHELQFDVIGAIRNSGFLVALPGTIDFGAGTPGQELRRRIHIRGAGNILASLPKEYIVTLGKPRDLVIHPSPTVSEEKWTVMDVVLRCQATDLDTPVIRQAINIRSAGGATLCTVPIRFVPKNCVALPRTY